VLGSNKVKAHLNTCKKDMDHTRVGARLDLQLDQQSELCLQMTEVILIVEFYYNFISKLFLLSKHTLDPGLHPKKV